MMNTIKTVKELKELLKDLPDDMLLVIYRQGMEKCGYMNNLFGEVQKMTKQTKCTYDRFDYTEYVYEDYVRDANGVQCLVFD